MPLKTERGPIRKCDALQRAVKQGAMRGLDIVGQGRLVNRKSVILACYHDLATRKILHRVICPVMTELHLHGLGASSKRQQLMAQADSEHRNVLRQELLDCLDCVITGLRVTGSVGQEYAVG